MERQDGNRASTPPESNKIKAKEIFHRVMRAGRLKFKVTIESSIESKDSFNSTTLLWEPVREVWAAIDPLRGGERFADPQIKADVDTQITIRTTTGLGAKHRFVYGERIFDIKFVPPVARYGKFLDILCKEAA